MNPSEDTGADSQRFAQRKHPTHGVSMNFDGPVVVFLTVCTKDRVPWLSTPETHELLRRVWSEATAWLVGRYMIMPDHIHLFATPGSLPVSLENWVKFWKSQFSKHRKDRGCRWQTDHWDTRIRNEMSYEEKWNYVVNNPVRHGLVERAENWPFQGEVFPLRW